MSRQNNKHGLLTILKEWVDEGKRHVFTICECGNFNLFSVKTKLTSKSCGCLVKKSIDNLVRMQIKPLGQSSFNEVYATYKRSAKIRGLEFNISEDDFKSMTSKNCHYCNTPPSNKMEKPNRNGSYVYSGLDRVDNSIGYILENVVPCCVTCNSMKMAMSYNEFITHLRAMLFYRRTYQGDI